MPNSYFQFKQFRIDQSASGMKVTTDGCLFGAWVANQIQKTLEPEQILDIGTGTGLLALIMAQATTRSSIDAIEINSQAYLEAKQNFGRSKWSERLNPIDISVQSFRPEKKYDLIICNPPFFKNNKLGNKKNKNQAVHSYTLSSDDLIKSLTNLLSEQGKAYVMYPKWEMDQFMMKSAKIGLHVVSTLQIRNRSEKDVFRTINEFRFETQKSQKQNINIYHESEYSNTFKQLLSPYYLNL